MNSSIIIISICHSTDTMHGYFWTVAAFFSFYNLQQAGERLLIAASMICVYESNHPVVHSFLIQLVIKMYYTGHTPTPLFHVQQHNILKSVAGV